MGFAELTKKSLRASQLSHGDLVGLGGSPVFDCFLSLSMFAYSCPEQLKILNFIHF